MIDQIFLMIDYQIIIEIITFFDVYESMIDQIVSYKSMLTKK